MNRRTVLKGGLVLAATAHTAVASGDKVRSTPQERIEAAVEQINQAMSEMHPGWQIDRHSILQGPQRYKPGGFEDLPPNIHAVVLFAHNDTDGITRDFHWYWKTTDLRA